jgi:chromosome segregation ATPase
VILLLGGGLGVKVVEWGITRDADKTAARGELWEEIGALRGRIESLEKRIEALQADKDRLSAENAQYRVENVRLKLEVNDLLEDADRPARYALPIEP